LTISYLLADAKLAEDISQHLIGGNLPGDLTQVEHAFANILREKVVTNAAF
jgi:hypothetical protein